MAMAWYVVHTYSGYENKAKLALEDAIRRYAVEDKFGEILVPTETVVEVKDGKKKTNTRKVFPGYIFV
jgi:transcriptional antiterminator NusG